jgi:hypothetical protein
MPGGTMPENGETKRHLWSIDTDKNPAVLKYGLDALGCTLASKVWAKAGLVIVSVRAGGAHKEQRFQSPDEFRHSPHGDDEFAWLVNMALLATPQFDHASGAARRKRR